MLTSHWTTLELVRARLDVQVAEASERPGPGPQLEPKRVAEQERGRQRAWCVGVRRVEGGGRRALGLERQIDQRRVVLGSPQRSEAQEIFAGLREDHPFAASRPDEIARLERKFRRHCRFVHPVIRWRSRRPARRPRRSREGRVPMIHGPCRTARPCIPHPRAGASPRRPRGACVFRHGAGRR